MNNLNNMFKNLLKWNKMKPKITFINKWNNNLKQIKNIFVMLVVTISFYNNLSNYMIDFKLYDWLFYIYILCTYIYIFIFYIFNINIFPLYFIQKLNI